MDLGGIGAEVGIGIALPATGDEATQARSVASDDDGDIAQIEALDDGCDEGRSLEVVERREGGGDPVVGPELGHGVAVGSK